MKTDAEPVYRILIRHSSNESAVTRAEELARKVVALGGESFDVVIRGMPFWITHIPIVQVVLDGPGTAHLSPGPDRARATRFAERISGELGVQIVYGPIPTVRDLAEIGAKS